MIFPSPLDIVLPCYNPAPDWALNVIESVKRLQTHLPDVTFSIILVNDGSAHGITEEDIQYLHTHLARFTYLSYPENKGKGHALRYGVQHSTHDFCLYTDVDFPYEEQSMAKLYHQVLQSNTDIAVGVRTRDYYQFVPPARARISQFLRFMTRKFLGLAVSDTQCGLKGFNLAGKELFLQTKIDRYLFDLEFIYLASKTSAKMNLMPVQVQLKAGVVFSQMNLSILMREGLSFVRLFLGLL